MKKTALTMILATSLLSGPAFADDLSASQKIPRLDHVYLIMMENHAYQQIIGSPNAPFINQMAESANLATNYFAVGHPSLTNYLEAVGGSNFGVTSDNFPNWHNGPADPSLITPLSGSGMDTATPANIAPFNTEIASSPYAAQTIADQLVAANKSWKTYQENLPAIGADNVNYSDGIFSNLSSVNQSAVQKLYAVKHNPFVYFDNIQRNADPMHGLNNVVGFDGTNGLYADLRAGMVPAFAFIAPNQCHDMHGAGGGSSLCTSDSTVVQMGDAMVQTLVKAIKSAESWKRGKNAIIVVWDENDFSTSPNQVVMLVDTNYGVSGVQSNKPYSHFSLLKTMEAGFGLPCLNHACDNNVQVMSDLFGGTDQR